MDGGRLRGQMHRVMSEEPEMPSIYFHSILCWCSLFSLTKTWHSLIDVIARSLCSIEAKSKVLNFLHMTLK